MGIGMTKTKTRKSSVLADAMTVVLALVAIGIFLQTRRPPRIESGWSEVNDSTMIEGLEEDSESGIRMGPDDPLMTIVEFMDFECSFCADFVGTTDSLLAEYPEDVAVIFYHFPLGNHRFAIPSAIAVECAHKQSAFAEMYRNVFAKRDSIGIKPWTSFAGEAGVADLNAFESCRALPPDSFPRIAAGLAFGERNGVRGTPSVFVNGVRRARGAPSLATLRHQLLMLLGDSKK
jgi:protein-disulfide isomerase